MDADTANFLHPRQRIIPVIRQERQQPARTARRLWTRIFRRKEITTFHRCLAVHMHFAARRGLFQ